MKKILLFISALFLLAASCKKDKQSTPTPTPPPPTHFDYNCVYADSVIFRYRTCGNSTKFDSVNLYYAPLDRVRVNFLNVTPAYMDSVKGVVTCDTINHVNFVMLFCQGITGPHDNFDTLYVYKRIVTE